MDGQIGRLLELSGISRVICAGLSRLNSYNLAPTRWSIRLLADLATGEFTDDVELTKVPCVLLHDVKQHAL